MPGIVVFGRRWSVGSDDLVVPGIFLFIVHFVWAIIVTNILIFVEYNLEIIDILYLWIIFIGYLIILLLSMVIEMWISWIATRGSILETLSRSSMKYLLYVKVVILLVETIWLSCGCAWLSIYYHICMLSTAKRILLILVIFNFCIFLSVLITVWCTYDAAGRLWVKMKKYQRSMRTTSIPNYRRSGSTRNWRQRKVLHAYEVSWRQRCRLLFCCTSSTDRSRNSFADIARLLSDFFRDLDVVPSDIVAGLILLRKFQKIERNAIVARRQNDTYEFLSGAPITPRTRFLALKEGGADYVLFNDVIYYAQYAMRAYGWRGYLMTSRWGACTLCCCSAPSVDNVDDNTCGCNYAALERLKTMGDLEIIYATWHVDVGETAFFIAIDYDRKKLVISVRGTLSFEDVLTDLDAEGEPLPLEPVREDWLGHKGMVNAAKYILAELEEKQLIERALGWDSARNTNDFQLVVVGHSLGAGTACILSILLRQRYPTLECFCYSPPGGLLSMPAVEYSKAFTVSVVIGKDVVPRIGLHQMETLRADLINAIKRSVDPKWKTISSSMLYCCCTSEPTSAVKLSTCESDVCEYMQSKRTARCDGIHPSDSSIALTCHQPLYPPGRIIHVVRHHPNRNEQLMSKTGPVYQALWAETIDFDEVIISPVMIQDHMPNKVLEALSRRQSPPLRPPPPSAITGSPCTAPTRHQVVTVLGPKKPQRISICTATQPPFTPSSTTTSAAICLETSFTSLHSPSVPPSNSSSITNGYHSTRSQISPLPLLQLKTQHIDLIHDDWFGLAPLASPESLSELSSISSRTSLLFRKNAEPDGISTPKIMRRTPKIIGDLSTCADDYRNVRNFRLCKVFQRRPSHTDASPTATNSSSNLSYESAASAVSEAAAPMKDESDDYQSAEDLLDGLLASAGCKDFFTSNTGNGNDPFADLLTPVPDDDLVTNIAINLASTHRTVPDKNVTFAAQVVSIEDNTRRRPRRLCDPPKTCLAQKRRDTDGCDVGFARAEALPLLGALITGGGNNSAGGGVTIPTDRTSPGFVKRKSHVYPTDVAVLKTKNESSV